MGSMTDAAIAAWQEEAGIEAATGTRAELLEKMSQMAFELIKVIELERSGIRDGDGHWHGSDVMGGMAQDLVTIIEDLGLGRGRSQDTPPAPERTTAEGAMFEMAREFRTYAKWFQEAHGRLPNTLLELAKFLDGERNRGQFADGKAVNWLYGCSEDPNACAIFRQGTETIWLGTPPRI